MRSYLNECERIEKFIGGIYTRLASVEAYSDGLRKLLRQLAEDEEGHAQQLEMAKGVPAEVFFDKPRLSPGSLAGLWFDVDRAAALSEGPPSSEEDVLALIRELETGCLQVHLLNSVHFRREKYGDLFRDLVRGDEDHLKAIDEYERSRGNRTTH